MVEHRRTKAVARRRGGRDGPGRWPDAATALSALARAWTTTMLASALLVAALAVAGVWDGAIFRQALRDTLGQDRQFAQPIGDDPGAALAAADDFSQK